MWSFYEYGLFRVAKFPRTILAVEDQETQKRNVDGLKAYASARDTATLQAARDAGIGRFDSLVLFDRFSYLLVHISEQSEGLLLTSEGLLHLLLFSQSIYFYV